MTFRRILIANRGEIAARIIRTCHRLGIEAVLGASAADLDSVPARMADVTVRLGGAKPAESYLNGGAVLAAAALTRADAIHPGYGFLAENAGFARSCAAAGIVFIGPAHWQLRAVGDKLAARRNASGAGLPVLPGGWASDDGQVRDLAEQIGWPVLVKAAGGGGGRGMRRVDRPADLGDAVNRAMAEADASFGDSRVYLERYLPSGRHVEVQLLGDGQRVIHVGDRDCSVQRRYQKLVEEAPAPDLGDGLRARMHRAAVALGRRLRYQGAGTAEFLVDVDSDAFYFLEMNARIQVEHPVTEEVSGIDLVAEQIAIAEGHPLSLAQADVSLAGHAIECRLNAEDWTRGFQPVPGTVTAAVFPAGDGIRVDTHVQAGTQVSPFYDPLLAKLIASGRDRKDALAKLRRALPRCEISGVPTNVPMHTALTGHADFSRGGVGTEWFTRFLRHTGSPDG